MENETKQAPPPEESFIRVVLDTVIPPTQHPRDGHWMPYDFEKETYLRHCIEEKIAVGIRQYGSLEAFAAQFEKELKEKQYAAEIAVQVYWMRKIQMEFITSKCTQANEAGK